MKLTRGTPVYSLESLKAKHGDNWRKALGIPSRAVHFTKKPVISAFIDFDASTRSTYQILWAAIADLNKDTAFVLYATGSRVNGNWKTPEEAEDLASAIGREKVKYSDYDFWTDAPRKPELAQLEVQHGIKFDLSSGDPTQRVRIEPPTL
jgi:hypothetical protein